MATKQTTFTSLVQWGSSAMLVAGLFVSMLAMYGLMFIELESYVVHIMFAYLLMGLAMLVARQSNLMLISFVSCALLCLFLKNASSTDVIHPKMADVPSISIAQITVTSSNDTPDFTLQQLLQTDVDILSVHEVTPDWSAYLSESLAQVYPYATTVIRPETFTGIALYSKYPIDQLDTFYYNDIPNLCLSVRGTSSETQVHFVSSYIYPDVLDNAVKTNEHLDVIGRYIRKLQGPVITFGDYNQLQWSKPIQDFRSQNRLQDSRRFSYFDYPSDHIFYSKHFQCTAFNEIKLPQTGHLGIHGSYQLYQENQYAQKAAQKF